MNAKARALGLADTHFANPSGLDQAGHYSSARDVTRLALLAMRRPFIRQTVRMRTGLAAGRTLATWNDLLGRFPGLIGVKTGHTAQAGWSEVAAARGRGLTIYATLLGSPTREGRNDDLGQLLAWGLSRYRVVAAVQARRVYATATTGYGRGPVRLVAERPLRRALRIGRPVVERVVAPTVVGLPVEKGEQLGVVRVYSRGRLIGERPLVAAESISAPGLSGKVKWYAKRTLANAWGLVT
jgi:D-alanyl-D-alanine carboxypeptidase